MMHPEASLRLGHALQAIRSIQTYSGSAPLQQCLANDLTCSAVLRQLGIVQDAWRVALMRFGAGDLIVWQGRLMAGVEQAGRGVKMDQQIAENLRRLGYEF
jgi:hypothetical protein